jgi:hypothetical protein
MASADHFLHGYGVCTYHWVQQVHTYPFKIFNMLAHQYALTRSRVLDKYIYMSLTLRDGHCTVLTMQLLR